MRSLALLGGGAVVREREADVVVPWWSFTKTLLAAAALRLVETGALRLDEPLPNRAWSLRHLLRHTSGLPDYGGLGDYHAAVARGEEPWTPAALRRRAGADRPLFAPGEGWSYSNIGYLEVRDLIEAATGRSLGAALDRLVLDPLDVAGARVAVTPGDLAGVEMGPAAGYHPGWVCHGLVVGPVRDAARALHGLTSGRLLAPGTLAEMRAGQPLPQHTRPPWRMAAYGLGLMTPETADGRLALGHTGGGPGSQIAVYQLADADRTIALFDDAPGVDIESAAIAEATDQAL